MDERWTTGALDRRLFGAGRDLAGEARTLGVPVEDVVRYARVRQIVLAAGRDEMTAELRAAGVPGEDLHAYLRVLMRVQQLRTRPDPQRARRLALPAGDRASAAEPARRRGTPRARARLRGCGSAAAVSRVRRPRQRPDTCRRRGGRGW
ncbi:MAG: hypothetical protein GEV12_23180 [Micromonosporaceae bacterium]|nr:hypothetical protein [Micromonosporaceae bacterium]